MGTTVDIEISADGINVSASGYKGRTCLAEFKDLINELESSGIKVDIDEQRLKSEFYVKQETQTRIRH